MKLKWINPMLGLTLVSPGFITIATSCGASSDIVILFTNDTHTAFENSKTGLGWSSIRGYRDWLESKGDKTLFVDSGDFISGSMYAPLSLGKYNTALMNACDIDLAIPGNHEFDFGKERFEEAINELICPVISSNLYHCKPFDPSSEGKPEETDPVFEPSKMFNINGMKIGFVGATTPQTTVATDTMSFKDENGNYIYTFLGTKDDVPNNFFTHIQTAVDGLRNKGADIVIALTHLGIGDTPEYKKYGSENLINHTKGIDIVLDGHSHTYQPVKMVKNKEGKDVALTQTGTKFESIGELTIHKNKKFNIKLLDKIEQRSEKVDDILNRFKSQAQEVIGETVKDNLDFDMSIYEKIEGEDVRVVRAKETTISEFVTDAISTAVTNEAKKSEVIAGDTIIPAFYNGGRIRESFNKGKITMGDVLNTTPFSDELVCRNIPGEILAQAFEYSISKKENLTAEAGAMLEVSNGFTAKYNISKATPVILDAYGCYQKMDPNKEWRLESLTYNGEQIYPFTSENQNQKYLVAGNKFIIKNCGDGYNMFDNENIEDVELKNIIGDAQAIVDYFKTDNLQQYEHLAYPIRINIHE